MIKIDFSLAIALYLSIYIFGIILYWIFSKRDKGKDLSLDPHFIWHCAVCTYTYINTREDVYSVCPRCGNYNKK